jgi:hypothetical protein
VLPDVNTEVRTAPTPVSLPTETDTAFIGGVTQRGWAKKPRLCRSLTDFVSFFGARLVTDASYDWTDTFFNEGGAKLYVSRVFGVGATAAKLELLHTAAKVLVCEAGSRGEPEPGLVWSEGMTVEVTHPTASTFKLVVTLGGVVVEESPSFSENASAVAWSNNVSNYLAITLGVESSAGIPDVLAAKALTAGSAGAAVADADYEAGLARIEKGLGPGQVALPGQTTETRQRMILVHCALNNRFGLLDAPNTLSVPTLTADAASLYTVPNNGRRYGQLFAPWDVIPGLVGGTTRTVPPSARAAAQYAVVDGEGNPNVAAAGERGRANYVLDLSQPLWTDAQRLELNNAGVTVSRRRFGSAIMTWGFRTLADQSLEEQWSQAQNVRLVMAYVAEAEADLNGFEFDQIDGFGSLLGQIKGALKTRALAFFNVGALYGATPQEAFAINVGEALNPPKQLQEGKVVTESALRVSPGVEQIVARIVKVPITQPLL